MIRVRSGSGIYQYVETPEERKLRILWYGVKKLAEKYGEEELLKLMQEAEEYEKSFRTKIRT